MNAFENIDVESYFIQFLSIKTIKCLYVSNDKNKQFIESHQLISCLKMSNRTGLIYKCNGLNFTKLFVQIYLNSYINIYDKNGKIEIDNLAILVRNCNYSAFIYLIKLGLVKKKLLYTKLIHESAIESSDINTVKFLFNDKKVISHTYYFDAIRYNFIDAVIYFKKYINNDIDKKKINLIYLESIQKSCYDTVKFVYTNHESLLEQPIYDLLKHACHELKMFEIIYNFHFRKLKSIDYSQILTLVAKYGNIDIVKWIHDKGFVVYNYNTLEIATGELNFEVVKHICETNTSLHSYAKALLIVASCSHTLLLNTKKIFSFYNIISYFINNLGVLPPNDITFLKDIFRSDCDLTIKLILNSLIKSQIYLI